MYFARIDDFYVGDGVIFYKVCGKVDMPAIMQSRLNNGEARTLAADRYDIEEHWLADWGHSEPFAGFEKNCYVAFDVKSTTFYPTMKHGRKPLRNVRNINVSKIILCPAQQT